MNIIEQNKEKINGILETFDKMIINGYSLNCNHIDNYIKNNNVEISKSITKRYIEALPDINVDEVPISEINKISSSIVVNERKYTGFNILEKDTLNLFSIISSGEYLINGFSNKLIREKYFTKEITKKDINKLTRLLSKLKAHGIIKKVARKNKYYLTTNGRKIINSILIYTRKTLLT